MKKYLIVLLLFPSCGLEPSRDKDEGPDIIINQPEPTPIPTPLPDPGSRDPIWSGDVERIVKEQCALSGCHAGAKFLSSERAIKASKSLQVISNGRMPPTFSPNYDLWSDKKKRRLLDFLSR